jgi:hypothetical protein
MGTEFSIDATRRDRYVTGNICSATYGPRLTLLRTNDRRLGHAWPTIQAAFRAWLVKFVKALTVVFALRTVRD